ncbi:GNAT family N-acetyltransferase [Thalassospira alkalitolerans]|uniref:GNAT family N-acetyltransferase n=1 Tax=Thalassospira alkalitolerans TaxID=1293890 RepID=UPI0030EBB9D5
MSRSLFRSKTLPDIRPVQRADMPTLINLIADHAAFERQQVDKAHLAHALPDCFFGDDACARVLVAECGGELVGYGTASVEFSTWRAACFLHLDCLYLAPQSRGFGLGTRMLAAFANVARAQNLGWMEWQTPDWNEDAARFYRRNDAVGQAKLRFSKQISG